MRFQTSGRLPHCAGDEVPGIPRSVVLKQRPHRPTSLRPIRQSGIRRRCARRIPNAPTYAICLRIKTHPSIPQVEAFGRRLRPRPLEFH